MAATTTAATDADMKCKKRPLGAAFLPYTQGGGGMTPIVALLYDFDKTLCTTDMEDYAFIPALGRG